MTRPRSLRVLIAVVAAMPAVVLTALPSHAATLSTGASDGQDGTFSAGNSSGDHTVSLNGDFAGVANGNNLTELFFCAATGTPDGTSMLMRECSLNGEVATVSESLPGEVVAAGIASFDLSNLPSTGLTLCSDVTATYSETTLGPKVLEVQTCSPPPLLTPPQIPTHIAIDKQGIIAFVESLLTNPSPGPCQPPMNCIQSVD